MKYLLTKTIALAILLVVFASHGCNTIAHFDQVAYNQTISVESDALSLMDKAVEDYSLHEKEIVDINNRVQTAYLYDKNRPKNTITEAMWKLMVDPKGALYGGFMSLWKSQKKLNPTFIQEAKLKIQQNFDRIAQLESKKIKS